MKKVEERIILPTIKGLQEEKIDYIGFIFFGLINVNNEPFVIEYNARLGDPETEAIMPRIQSDLVDVFEAVVNENIQNFQIEISELTSVNVMLTSKGYPLDYEKGFPVKNLEKVKGSLVFHSGTSKKGDEVITSGGRVLSVTTLADSISEAAGLSVKVAGLIDFENKYFRKDIGFDLV